MLIRIDTGMPQEWQKILDDNGITRAEQEENPDKVNSHSRSPLFRSDISSQQVLAVVQYFQNRDVPENQEDELWSKMRNAGPSHGVEEPPMTSASREMSRENSHDGAPPSAHVDKFANPVSLGGLTTGQS